MIVIRDPRTFYFNFDWNKDVDDSLKHDIKFITKSSESLTENKMKNKKLSILNNKILTKRLHSKFN